MKIKTIALIIISLINLNIGFSQEMDTDSITSNFSSYKLIWDNDVMMQTDYYYTQGLAMELILPAFYKNPLNYILIKPKSFSSIYGLSIHQETYTPTIIKVEEILYGDRPYAGSLYVKSFIRSSNEEKRLLFKSEFDFGFIGPYSFAGVTQYRFHVLSDNNLPLGWANEIKQAPILNYNFTINKGLIVGHNQELQAESRARIGSLYDDILLGINYKYGLFNSTYKTMGENMYMGGRKFQAYLNFNPQIKAVGYNATMQGSPFVSNSDSYVILPSEVERLVYSLKFGGTIMYHNVGASFNLNWQSPEFKGGLNHTYHSLNLIFNF